ncbi:MAG: DUF4038 domain-containing protein [Verrucomicrobiota bacterium]
MSMRFLVFSLLLGLGSLHGADLPELRVSADKRHLETADGKPFFMLGDTAWELFHRLDREETQIYLKKRAEQGFNTVFAVALAEFEFHLPNAAGELPLENNDPTKPREAYFAHVDWVIDEAAKLGLRTALLPTWGDKWNKKWGKGPEIFTPENAAVFCEWLGKRYADKPVVWVLGGDRPIENDTHRAIIRAMAAGLKKGDGGKHLITFHPQGRKNSSDFWPDEFWLDFHMFQSGHAQRFFANYDMNAKNLSLPALKPTLDGEPCYEDHPVRGLMKDGKPTEWFDDKDVRVAAWRSVLSGACGHVYGTHSIWQFHDLTKRKQQTDARTPWKEALDLPGANQMGVLRKIIDKQFLTEGLDWTKLRRDDSLVTLNGIEVTSENKPMAAMTEDGNLAVIYVPGYAKNGLFFNGHKQMGGGIPETAMALDPVTGDFLSAAATVSGAGPVYMPMPNLGKEPWKGDWLLVLRKAKK